MLEFSVNVVAIPINNVVFISLSEFMKGVYLILNYFFAGAKLEVIIPGVIDCQRFWFWSLKESMMNCKWPGVHVVSREEGEYKEDQQGVDPADENGALSELNMPELKYRNG